MCILLAKPSVLLSGFVKQYWFIDSVVSNGAEYMQRIVPSGLPELLFFQGTLPLIANSDGNLQANAVVSGHHQTFYDFQIDDSFSLFAVTFQPHALKVFFDIPGSEFLNNKIPLGFILKDEASELEENIAVETDFFKKIERMESFLLKKLHSRSMLYEYRRVDYCVNTMINSKGLSTVDDLASNAFLSRKQLERNFSDYVGTSPKNYLRTVRFQNAIHQKAVNPKISLTALACDCGFYDQAHMINEFKKFSGLTPGQYFSLCEPVSDLFA